MADLGDGAEKARLERAGVKSTEWKRCYEEALQFLDAPALLRINIK